MVQKTQRIKSFILVSVMVVLPLFSGCRPSGPAELKKSAAAFQQVSRMRMEWSSQTDHGAFKHSAELDCNALYYHRISVKDLSEKGVAAETRSALGSPKAH